MRAAKLAESNLYLQMHMLEISRIRDSHTHTNFGADP